jgi:hypothetical protein
VTPIDAVAIATWLLGAIAGSLYAAYRHGARTDEDTPAWICGAIAWPLVFAFCVAASPFWLARRLGEQAFRRKRKAWLARQPKPTGDPYRAPAVDDPDDPPLPPPPDRGDSDVWK